MSLVTQMKVIIRIKVLWKNKRSLRILERAWDTVGL